ncbi:MAG: acyl-CoA synthase [Solirubrobacterales bacterium]|jgi:putative sterol carrier protein|nr:acyl-CoA synthase [Solirubrobacterales bacterium]
MIDLNAEPSAVYREVVALDDGGFKELMAEQASRDKVIDALVEHFAGRVRPEKTQGMDAVLHIKLWDRPGGGYDHRELVIHDGTCTASAVPLHEDAKITLKVRPEDLRAIVTGKAGPKRLALRGKLRVLGDLGFAMKLTELFDLSA